MEEYITIQKDEVAEITEKKSKFIANLYYIQNVQDAEIKIKEIRKIYHDARHHCIAYRVLESGNLVEKASDDGEPSGTAGAPMLNILQKNNLCNVLVIVTRYFGGVLLGTGGLVRAYTEVTQKAIETASFVKSILGIEMQIRLDYPHLENFKYYCKANDIKIINIEYFDDILIKVQLEKNRKEKIMKDIEIKNLIIKEIQELEEKYIQKDVEKNK